ncbi:hypothetical protein BCR42DRAFT_122502 [Absidia repens]|uniref:Kinesin motor domain-containing protein n=1 Tax=Absidia repens TaxID=90262 RepID=A0A1X2I4I4_9FUNG|nr:hypothetical protein BCR42DRAFT_122502 [Absidia repens]
MGIGLDSFIQKSNEGIVPRFIYTMFEQLSQRQNNNNDHHHQISVSFLELHNEDLVDLLSPSVHTLKKENQPMVVIREDSSGAICWSGIREEVVTNPEQLLCLLEKGSVARTTAATDMNISSSRSHAIFSIQLRQTISNDQGQTKTTTSKFHFVDLAGSERLKRTNAVGSRAKEGISINSGLLALGNVISALGDESRRVSHIPYRDSKLTRLLQDSLGGNSQTLMLACVSPAWSNHKETINTLKYANRARNIKNRVVINQEVNENQQHIDSQHGEHVKKLKSQILKLRNELAGNDEFIHAVNDEMDGLKTQVESLKKTINSLVQELAKAKFQCDNQKQVDQQHDQPHPTTASHDLAQEYAYTIEELKIQVALLQQEKQQQTQQLPSSSLPQQRRQPIMTQALSKHSQHGKESSLTERKKKRHSYRFGSKKIRGSFNSIRKRQQYNNSNTTANHHPARPTPLQTEAPSLRQNSVNKDEWKDMLNQQKCNLDDELAYVDSKKSSILGDPYWLKGSFNDLISFSSSFPHETTLHITDSKNGHGVPTSNPSSSTELAQMLQRFGDSLQRQRRFLHSLTSLPVSPGTTTSQDQVKLGATLRKQYKKELDDLKRQHDLETKKQLHEHQTLKRHYQQLIISSERARTQHNATILTLKQKLEVITRDKKKLMKKSKQDADRARDRGRQLEKQVQKLERQEIKSTHLKKRLERDLHTQKQVNKHAKEDIGTLGSQLTSVALMIQKVLQSQNSKKIKKSSNNNKMVLSAPLVSSDRTLLAKAVACARVRGYLVAQKHGVGTNRRGAVKAASLQQRLIQKKQLIHKAISLYVQAYVPMQLHEQLEQKRDQLQKEQQTILAEHDTLVNDMDDLSLESVNQRMNAVAAEYHQVCSQIQRLQHQQQKRMSSGKPLRDYDCASSGSSSDISSNGDDDDVNNSDSSSSSSDDTWMDDIPFWNTEDAEVAYENVLTLVRTLEPEETRSILETLVNDVIRLETETQQQCYIVAQSDSTFVSLEKDLQWTRHSHPYNHHQKQQPLPPQHQDSFVITPTSTTTSTSSKTSSTIIPRPSISAAIRRSGLPIPRRSSCK